MSKEISIEQVQALLKSVAENRLGELTLECEGFKLKIKGAVAAQPVAAPAALAAAPAAAMTATTTATASATVAATSAVPADASATARYLTSPIVGTFYASASPDKQPFATVGTKLAVGDTAFIVESMKVMNEVPAELSGVVAEVLLESGAPVEFGQNILRLE